MQQEGDVRLRGGQQPLHHLIVDRAVISGRKRRLKPDQVALRVAEERNFARLLGQDGGRHHLFRASIEGRRVHRRNPA